ncbi:hypothetical protein [uncultured Sphaerochaeta sp.]|uniref:hypothetical protein n=1 Tax=uncultured Sphaerochaeta sp. TaxID=886478 RepID=UPI002A0A8218|nr:hypothetical protein [uncultured Sphaerochaeta sp.]
MITKGDISLEKSEEGGYDLWIKKKHFLRSIQLVSTSLNNTDIVKPSDSLFKSFGLNEFFRINGTMQVPTENTEWFFGNSAIHEHPYLGLAFQVHIPYEISIDASSAIKFSDGGFLSIIAFSKNRSANRALYRINRFDAIASQKGEGEIVVAGKKEVQKPATKTVSEDIVQSLQQNSQEPVKKGMEDSSTSLQAGKEPLVVAAKKEVQKPVIKTVSDEISQSLQQSSQEPAKIAAENLSVASSSISKPELVDSEENGYVIDATDPNSIEVYINKIFRFDPEHGIKDGSYGYVFRNEGEPIALVKFSVTNMHIVAILKELYQPQNPIKPFDKILLDLK